MYDKKMCSQLTILQLFWLKNAIRNILSIFVLHYKFFLIPEGYYNTYILSLPTTIISELKCISKLRTKIYEHNRDKPMF